MDDQALRTCICETGRELLENGLVARTWGNVSARADGGHYLVTPSGMDYGSIAPEDIAACTELYNYYIENTCITLEEEPVTPEEFGARAARITKNYPYIVARDGAGKPIGFAYLDVFNPRSAYRCTAEVGFSDYCPCMVVDHALAGNAMTYMTELVGQGAMDMSKLTGGKPGGGSEDFAFVSHEVPTVSMFLSAGNAKEGYAYGQHHPKVKFDDSILYEGSAAYSWFALRWLSENK